MAKFPLRESDITVLAQAIIQGLNTQAETFPRSPFTSQELLGKLQAYVVLHDGVIRQQALLAEAVALKQASLDELTEAMKAVLRYIENAAEREDQLAQFGWSGRRSANAQQAPGQCRTLEAPRQGSGWLFLDWKEPADGGKPSHYVVEMRELPDGAWQQVATTVVSEVTLVNQPQANGRKREYRAYAANKAGNGPASNAIEMES